MKFGGTSVEDGPAFERVAHIVSSYERATPVVVVSAMSGVTDALITSLRVATKGQLTDAVRSLDEHFERHLKVPGNLSAAAPAKLRVLVEKARREIIELLRAAAQSRVMTAQQQDLITSHGERLSANLLTLVLGEYGLPATYVDARRCILTNADHGNAKPRLRDTSRQTRAEIKPLLEAKRIPVLGGFFGATMNGVTTTLGRGSSDYTATLVSAALRARETQIWTDVDGVHTADPRLVKSARTVSRLTYAEAAELARLGARVLHPKMIHPVLEQRIPIRICNSRAPDQNGTLICGLGKGSPNGVKAIAYKTDLTRIDIASTPARVANGFLHTVKKIFNRHQRHMEIVAMSEVAVSFACEEGGALSSMVLDLQEIGSVRIKRHRAMIGCVGEGLLSAPANARRVLGLVSDIDSTLAWRSTSSINLMSMVKVDSVGPVLRRLHKGIFEGDQERGDVAQAY